MKKNFWKNFLILGCEFVLIYIFAIASIDGLISPFAYGLAVALVFSGKQKSYFIAPLYFIASVLVNPSMIYLISAGVSASILLTCGLIFGMKKSKTYINVSVLVAGLSAYIYYGYVFNYVSLTIVYLILNIITCIAMSHFIKAIYNRPFVFRFTLDELLSACFMLMVLGVGFSSIDIGFANLYHIVGILWVLVCVYTLGGYYGIISSCMYGAGSVVASLDISSMALFVFMAVLVTVFRSPNRLIPVFSVILIDVVYGVYFTMIYDLNYAYLIETLISSSVFLMIPISILDYANGFFADDSREQTAKSIINRSRHAIYRRLVELSDVFADMDIVFRQMVKGNIPVEDAKKMLANEACNKLCANCPNKTKCLKNKIDAGKIFYEIITVGFERGKATLLDLPAFLTSQCQKTNQILLVINQLILQYKQYANMINNLDSSRILIAEQLLGVSKIMKSLGEDLHKSLNFDSSLENKVVEELIYNNIVCNEAMIFHQNDAMTNVNLMVQSDDAMNVNISKITSRLCGGPMSISEVLPSKTKGWSLINLVSAPRYDIIFGYANRVKTGEEISGDNYSLLRLYNNKFMMAICDGMGSGEKANKVSELAINLVENFYKADFSNEIILSSVNKLLSLNNEETFTALDICVIDLNNSFADFIKLGAPIGFIKKRNETEVVEGGSLPVGILNTLQPSITKTVLGGQDIFILCSDGVVDSFDNIEFMQAFINNIDSLHPQYIADAILEKALEIKRGIAPDDMTVLVGRVFEKM